MRRAQVETVLRCYPQIFFACHRRHVRDQQAQAVLSAQQASVLDHLDEVERTSLFELARHMGVTASSMSLMVDRLERGGYAARALDRRPAPRGPAAHPRGRADQTAAKGAGACTGAAMLARREEPKRRQALRRLELLAEAASEMIASGDLNRILRGGAA